MSRGVGSYIEDRVDLTLLEIKHALDGEYHKSQHKDDILYALYIKTQMVYEHGWTILRHLRNLLIILCLIILLKMECQLTS